MLLLLIGAIYIISGIIHMVFPAKRINASYGYRTRFSMRNNDTWQEAQHFGCRLHIEAGIVIFIIGATIFAFLKEQVILEIIIFIIFAVFNVFEGDHYLNTIFNKDGTRK